MRKRGYISKLSNLEILKVGKLPLKARGKLAGRSIFSIKHRVFSIAVLGVSGFILYVAITTSQSAQNASILQEIEHVLYPVQARLLGAQYKLEIVQRELEASVLTADQKLVVDTGVLAEEFKRNLFAVAKLAPEIASDVDTILDKFDAFYLSSSSLALTLSKSDTRLSHYADKANRVSDQYAAVTNQLQALLNAVAPLQNKSFPLTAE